MKDVVLAAHDYKKKRLLAAEQLVSQRRLKI